MALQRLSAILCAAWLGALLCIAGLAAPSAFAVLERSSAGALVARLFAVEAPASLLLSLALVLLDRWRMKREATQVNLSAAMLLALAALFCTVVGYYVLQPLMAQARVGQGGALSFAQLHGISLGLFGLKMALVAVLAWRLTAASDSRL